MSVTFTHCTPEAERLIVHMARVSSPENADNLETAPRLLRYLIRKNHWSPFEMASLCVHIDTERDISAQILRHRSFSFQEYSSRYSVMPPAEIPAFRRQDEANRQSSHDDLPEDVRVHFERQTSILIRNSHLTYREMLDKGVAKETARRILPMCTPTSLYMHGTLRSWIHYIQLRSGPETQLEHRQIALACQDIFTQQFPTIAEAAFFR